MSDYLDALRALAKMMEGESDNDPTSIRGIRARMVYWAIGEIERLRATGRVFSREPTARGDDKAAYLRTWYENNRESWWDRHRFIGADPDRKGTHADEFMLGMIEAMRRIDDQCRRQDN